MSTTGEQGFVFSLDLVVAVIAMLLMLSLMVNRLDMAKDTQIEGLTKVSLERKALFLLDTIVKNNYPERPLLGSARFDQEKHRAMANDLDLEMLQMAKNPDAEKFFVSRLSVRTRTGKREILPEKGGKNCVSLDRIALVQEEIGKLEVTVCEN